VASTILVVAYGALLHSGILDWPEVGRQFAWLYLTFVVAAYVGMLGAATERAVNWLFPEEPAEQRQETQQPTSSETGNA